MKRAIYPGSFDPITVGHIDIIQRVAGLFDELIVLVANSTSKKYLFSIDERKQLITDSLIDPKIKVESYEGLLADYARDHNAHIIVRGIRAVSDFEYEMTMANMNKKLNENLETVTVFADPNLNYISSSIIKEIAKLGGDLTTLTPPNVHEALVKKFNKGNN